MYACLLVRLVAVPSVMVTVRLGVTGRAGRLAGWQDGRVGFQGRLSTRLTSREDLGREWFWPLMAGRTSGGHIRAGWRAGWQAGWPGSTFLFQLDPAPGCLEDAFRFGHASVCL